VRQSLRVQTAAEDASVRGSRSFVTSPFRIHLTNLFIQLHITFPNKSTIFVSYQMVASVYHAYNLPEIDVWCKSLTLKSFFMVYKDTGHQLYLELLSGSEFHNNR